MFDQFSREEFYRIRKDGIEYLELGSGFFKDKSDEEKRALVADFKEKSAEAGLVVWSIHLPYGNAVDISSTDEETRKRAIEYHKNLMAIAEPLNVRKFVIHPSAGAVAGEERTDRIKNCIASLKVLTSEVRKYNAQLALEVLPRTCLANTSDEILEIVRSVGNGLEVCFDSNHLLQEKPEEFVEKVGKFITTVHISDYNGIDENHWLPGRGNINWTRVISALSDAGFRGPFMYEVVRRPTDNPAVTTRDLVAKWHELKSDYRNGIERRGSYPQIEDRSLKVLKKIAFGSCASQDKPQPIWETVISKSPDLFLFIGDNIYGDTEDMAVMKAKYEKLAAIAGYQKLKNTCEILSVWDDHDYGVNDGWKAYPQKEASKEIFLDFFNVDPESPRRERPGIYGSKTFGMRGKIVQIILLDTRYFKDAQVRNPESAEAKKEKNIVGRYLPTNDTTTTILGADQWEWLEDQLRVPADLRIVVSSIQVVSYEKGMESWGNFPHERRRLFRLIDKTRAEGVFFISGDVHFSELSVTDEGPFPLYDLTSSGITNTKSEWAQAVNSYRVSDAYAEPNFGLITIDWSADDPAVTFQVIGVRDNTAIERTVRLSEISRPD